MDELRNDAGFGSSRGKHFRERGFSLLELVIAFSILAIGVLGIMGAQMKAMSQGQKARHRSAAQLIAQNKLDEFQRVAWGSIPTTSSIPGGWTDPLIMTNVVEGENFSVEQRYSLAWRITDVDVGRTRSVDVRVSWQDEGMPTRNVSLSSIRFNR